MSRADEALIVGTRKGDQYTHAAVLMYGGGQAQWRETEVALVHFQPGQLADVANKRTTWRVPADSWDADQLKASETEAAAQWWRHASGADRVS
ncbi:MAG: hypothetical protein V9E82_03960 [Candidatus Nanopelagicales bacterium]